MSNAGGNYGNSLQNQAGAHGAIMCEMIAKAHTGRGHVWKNKAIARRIKRNAYADAVSKSVGRICIFVLVDYRNKNEQIKKKSMTQKQAWDKNDTLAGTGLSWAKLR